MLKYKKSTLIDGEECAVIESEIDSNGLHIIPKDPVTWERCRWSNVLKRQLESGLAMRLFLYHLEEAAYAHEIYGHGRVSWNDYQSVKHEVELTAIILGSYIRLMNYGGNCVELAIQEMMQSRYPWLPILAKCLETQEYTELAYQEWLYTYRAA